MTRCRRFVAVVGLVFAVTGPARPALADERMDALATESARTLFTEGSAHFQAGRWEPALAAFQRSHALVPSPNTMLMIARSFRELGRLAEAGDAFEKAALEAAERVAKGDAKYSPTERAATEEGRKVRAMLGNIRVRVGRFQGVTVTIDGRQVLLDSSGATTVMHPPGSATVVVRDASGAEQKQTVSVNAGSTVEMEFSGDASRPATTGTTPPTIVTPPSERPAEPKDGGARSWAVPAAIGSGVLVLAGTAMFIGFGSASHTTYERLESECGPSFCGPSQRDDADTAKRQQTFANIGIVAASVAAVATVAFVVVALTSPGRPER